MREEQMEEEKKREREEMCHSDDVGFLSLVVLS